MSGEFRLASDTGENTALTGREMSEQSPPVRAASPRPGRCRAPLVGTTLRQKNPTEGPLVQRVRERLGQGEAMPSGVVTGVAGVQ